MTSNDIAGILVVVSRALDYPDDQFIEELSQDLESVIGLVSSTDIQVGIKKRLKPLAKMNAKDLQELYVETFDYKENTGLYMTAHELGDSPRRGEALIKLKSLISETGYEFNDNELADYIPMLLELLAVVPEVGEQNFLKRRMAYTIHRILKNLPTDNPYYQVVETLMMYVFDAPRAEEITQLENEREEADLDPLPYPMHYQ